MSTGHQKGGQSCRTIHHLKNDLKLKDTDNLQDSMDMKNENVYEYGDFW
jgi:hypothetical protein